MALDKNDVEKFRRHMGAGKYVSLVNDDNTEDQLYFKPLSCEFLPDMMHLALVFELTKEQKNVLKSMKSKVQSGEITREEYLEKCTEFDEENSKKVLLEENSRIVIKLLDEMVRSSYPEVDTETRKAFIMNNFSVLQGVLFELNQNISEQKVDEKILKKIEQVKAAKNAQA